MVAELTVHGAANVIELFVQTLVLQTTSFLVSGLVTWLSIKVMRVRYLSSRLCGIVGR